MAKVLAVGTVKGLNGIGSMVRDGPFLHDGVTRPAAGGRRATYLAIASNYEPTERGLLDFAKDRLTDALFGERNDLVVPTDGVFCRNGAACFPIAEPFVLDSSAVSATRATSPTRACRTGCSSGCLAEPR